MVASALSDLPFQQDLDVSSLRPGLRPQAQPSGPGALRVTGAGAAVVRGKASVVITGHGVGSVWVRDAEVLTVQGFGRRTHLADGSILFYGFRGTITASGNSLVVTMIGGRIDFTTSGSWSLRFSEQRATTLHAPRSTLPVSR